MLRASKPATTPCVVSPFAAGGIVRPHVYGSGQVGSRRSSACPSGNCATVPHTARIPGQVAPGQRRFAQYLSEKLHGCPCGYWGDPEHACSCSPMVISRYQKRLSGPLLGSHRYPRRSPPRPVPEALTTSAAGSRRPRSGHTWRRRGAAIGPVRQREGWPGRRPDHQRRHTCLLGPPRCATTARWTRPAGNSWACLVEPSAVAYWSALRFWSFTEQVPQTVFVQSPRRKLQSRLVLAGVQYQIVTIHTLRFFGLVRRTVDEQPIRVTDKPRKRWWMPLTGPICAAASGSWRKRCTAIGLRWHGPSWTST